MELYGHNKITSEKAAEMLWHEKECCVIQATGTGKTYVTMQLLNTIFYGLNTLYVVPTMSIAESIKLYEEWDYPNVKFSTYESLHKISLGDYDVLILDEVHRAGAKTWLPKVLEVKKHMTYVLGLSATEFRYLDHMRSMAEELFGDHVVYGPNIMEAVRDNILPGFEYVAILTDVEQFLVDKKVEDDDVKERVRTIYSEYTLNQRIKKHIRDEHRKCVIFFPNYNTMDNSDADIKDWLGENVKIFELKGNLTAKANRKAIKEFNECKERCVLKAVNKANEGIHIKDVTLLIFARKTTSGNIFLQQLGRALSASNKHTKPLILDLVQNYNNMHIIEKTFDSAMLKDMKCRKATILTNKKGEQKIMPEVDSVRILLSYDDVSLEIEEVLSKIMSGWTKEEDDILSRYYTLEGKEVYRRLSGRTAKDCEKRVKILGVTRNRRWSKEEDDILRKHWKEKGRDIYKDLPIRTLPAILARVRVLGLDDGWTAEEEDILCRYWWSEREEVSNRLYRHSKEDIQQKVKELDFLENMPDLDIE